MGTLTPQILAMYIGQKVRCNEIEGWVNSGRDVNLTIDAFADLVLCNLHTEVKPLLRRLSSLTQDEIIWMFVLRATANKSTVNKQCRRTSIESTFMQIEFDDLSADYQDIKTLYPAQFSFLCSKGFDLFGLIDAGLAIESSKINN